jgi:uncharacterized protein YfeS
MLRLAGLMRPGQRLMSLQPDLFNNLHPFSSNVFDDCLISEQMPKFSSQLFFGKQLGDDQIEIQGIVEARKTVTKMLSDNSSPVDFANLAHDVLVKHLENKEHRFAVPSDLMFIGRGSPVRPLFDETLGRAFTTARNALGGKRENFSGFAIAGTKGSGKSTLTRLVALLSGLLIPNFQSVFIDLVGCEKLRIDRVLREAAVIVGVCGAAENDNLSTVIGRFTQNKCAIGLFLDELPSLYNKDRKDEWGRIHSVLDNFGPTFVMANGGARSLPAMVRRDIHDMSLLQKWIGPTVAPLVSLNATKMRVKMLSRFTEPEHYRSYLKARPHVCKDLRCDATKEDEFIRYLHLVSGGVLRRIRLVNEHSKLSDLAEWINSYPDDGTLEKAIFAKLVEPVITGSKKFDIFDMPQISEDLLEEVLSQHYISNNNEGRKCVHDLVDNDILQVIEKGTSRSFTFGSAAYFKLSLRSPVMFISHRMSDTAELKVLIEGLHRETRKFIRVVSCEDGASQECIRKKALNKYMDIYCVTGITDKCGEEVRKVSVVLLTDAYIQRIEEYYHSKQPNGCARELFNLIESDQSHVYYFMAACLDWKNAVMRLETANPEWKGKFNDKLYYKLEEPVHFKLLANTVLYHAYQGEIEHSAQQTTDDTGAGPSPAATNPSGTN